MFFILTINI